MLKRGLQVFIFNSLYPRLASVYFIMYYIYTLFLAIAIRNLITNMIDWFIVIISCLVKRWPSVTSNTAIWPVGGSA